MKDMHFSDKTLNSLNTLFADGRSPHAVLIDGGSEEERLALARLAAKKIVCGSDAAPCNSCEHCRKADLNIHPDIITVAKPDEKKNYVKADVKKMIAESFGTPNESDIKVYIITEMQQMNEESQNLLLKTLEEPPKYVAFILTSATGNAVIGTVLSRVVRLHLNYSSNVEYSEKAVEIVADLSSAILTPYELDRVIAVAPMDNNKPLTTEVLDLFLEVLRDAISLKNGGKAELNVLNFESQKLSESINLKKLLDMYDTVNELIRSLQNNPNYPLLSTVLCATL